MTTKRPVFGGCGSKDQPRQGAAALSKPTAGGHNVSSMSAAQLCRRRNSRRDVASRGDTGLVLRPGVCDRADFRIAFAFAPCAASTMVSRALGARSRSGEQSVPRSEQPLPISEVAREGFGIPPGGGVRDLAAAGGFTTGLEGVKLRGARDCSRGVDVPQQAGRVNQPGGAAGKLLRSRGVAGGTAVGGNSPATTPVRTLWWPSGSTAGVTTSPSAPLLGNRSPPRRAEVPRQLMSCNASRS